MYIIVFEYEHMAPSVSWRNSYVDADNLALRMFSEYAIIKRVTVHVTPEHEGSLNELKVYAR